MKSLRIMDKTPRQLGYRMKAEWERQDAIWLTWPQNRRDWPGRFGPIPWVFVEIIRLVTLDARVRLLVRDQKTEDIARGFLERSHVDLDKVEFFHLLTNRGWMRDCGPVFVTGKAGKAMVDWRFNAWAKYPNYKRDDAVPEALNASLKLPRFVPMHKGRRVVLEGGSIDVNGKGSLLTTEECLLSKVQERNPGFTREDYEQVFHDYLGITNTIWLGKGIEGDDTHGHVDDLARFVNATTVAAPVESDKKSANYAILRENITRLNRARDERGKPLNVVELPHPKPIYFEGVHLPASYANFLITNQRVIVPVFNDPNDRTALNVLAAAMPNHEIVGLYCGDLIWGFGAVHCLSQQEPA